MSWTRVQAAGAQGSGTINTTLSSTAAGNLLICFVEGHTSISVSDNQSQTWTALTSRANIPTSTKLYRVFYVLSTVAGVTTVTNSGGAGTDFMAVVEYSAPGVHSFVSGSEVNSTGTGVTTTSGITVTGPTIAGDLLLLCVALDNESLSTYSAGSGITALASTGGTSNSLNSTLAVGENLSAAGASPSVAITWTPSAEFGATAVAFRSTVTPAPVQPARRRTSPRTATRAGARAVQPPPAQLAPPPAEALRRTQFAVRPARGRSSTPVPAQVNPPIPPVETRPDWRWRIRRPGRAFTAAPPQVNPPKVPSTVRPSWRDRIVRPGRAFHAAPPQQTPIAVPTPAQTRPAWRPRVPRRGTSAAPVPAWAPTLPNLAGLGLWLRADTISGVAPGAFLTSWTDESPAGLTVTQPTGGVQPTYVQGAQNGLPGVRFAGGHYLTNAAAYATGPSWTAFVVAKQTAAANAWTLFNGNGNGFALGTDVTGLNRELLLRGQADVVGGAATLNVARIRMGVRDGNTLASSLVVDGTLDVSSGAGYSNAAGGLTIGAFEGGAGSFWTGDIYEVVGYTRTLSNYEIGLVTAYLARKWLITAQLPGPEPIYPYGTPRRRWRVLRRGALFRPTPAQAPPPYPPVEVLRRWRLRVVRRGASSTPVPPQVNPPRLPDRVRPAWRWRIRRPGTTASPVPPQVIIPAPPFVPGLPPHHVLARGRARRGSAGPPLPQANPPAVAPVQPHTERRRIVGRFRGRFALGRWIGVGTQPVDVDGTVDGPGTSGSTAGPDTTGATGGSGITGSVE